MMNDNATWDKNAPETISFFSKKTHFFRFFRLFFENSKKFSGPFWPQKNEHHNFFRHFFIKSKHLQSQK
jgi:hypothetical protein